VSDPVFCYAITPDQDTKLDAGFLDTSYFKYMQDTYGRGSHHSGWDLNLKGLANLPFTGANRDLGYPVRSCFPGTVTFAGYLMLGSRKSGYGRVVKVRTHSGYMPLIRNALAEDLEVLDIVYCHLLHECVSVGDPLHAGEVIGSLGQSGKSEQSYPAHLHIAALKIDTPEVVPPQGGTQADKERIERQFINPKFLWGSRSRKLRFSDQPTALNPDRLVYAQ
jgi:murein DD-endopeptidase MepM/ murein hydrolase activator NlpD